MSQFDQASMGTALVPASAEQVRLAGITIAHAVLPEPCPETFDPIRDVAADDKADVEVALRMVGLK